MKPTTFALCLAHLGCTALSTEAVATAPEEPGRIVLGRLVVWDEPRDRAPAVVRALVENSRLLLELLDSAPHPTVSWSKDPEAWHTWSDTVRQSHFAPYEAHTAQVSTVLARHDLPDAIGARARLFFALTTLVGEYGNARYLAELGIGPPAVGSCYGGPQEAYGNILNNALEAAESCLELSRQLSGPMASNVSECRKRAEWIESVLSTAIEGVCEVDVPIEW